MSRRYYWQQRPVASIIMALAMLAVVALVDYVTGPSLNFAIAYFIPIVFAAWSLGRGAAIVTALISSTQTISEQALLISGGEHPWILGTVDVVLRSLVLLFVAEVSYRLIQSATDASNAADDLRRVNGELQRTYAMLNEDMRAAGLLQSSVLAFDLPATKKCEVGACLRMAGPIGGDFADAGFADGRIYVCVGDIAGKGMPAALFSTLLEHLLKDALRLGLRSGDVVTALNAGLSQTLPAERFVTLFYMEIDPATGRAEYVNAGHPDGLLLRHDTGEIEALPPTDPILTLYGNGRKFSARTIQLDAMDSVVVYTDGAVESKVPDGTRLGEEPIRRLTAECAGLSARDMAQSICDSIEAAIGGSPRDDLTVLCVKMIAPQEAPPGLDDSDQLQ